MKSGSLCERDAGSDAMAAKFLLQLVLLVLLVQLLQLTQRAAIEAFRLLPRYIVCTALSIFVESTHWLSLVLTLSARGSSRLPNTDF
jgi:hypothetical protein